MAPLLVFSTVAALHFAMALRTSHHVSHTLGRNSQLKRLLWFQALWLPVMGAHFTLATYATNRSSEAPYQLLSALSIAIGGGVLTVTWSTNRALRTASSRVWRSVAGTRTVATTENVLTARATGLMENKQQLASFQMAAAVGSAATLPVASTSRMGTGAARWASSGSECAFGLGGQVMLNQSIGNDSNTLHTLDSMNGIDSLDHADPIETSTTTTTSRSTGSRVYRSNRKHHHRHHRQHREKRAESSQSGALDMSQMLNDSNNYIDPYGYFSYDNDAPDEDDYDREGDLESNAPAQSRAPASRHRVDTYDDESSNPDAYREINDGSRTRRKSRHHHHHRHHRSSRIQDNVGSNAQSGDSVRMADHDWTRERVALTGDRMPNDSSINARLADAIHQQQMNQFGQSQQAEYINLPSNAIHSNQDTSNPITTNQGYALYSVPQALMAPAAALYSNVQSPPLPVSNPLMHTMMMPAGSRANIFSMLPNNSNNSATVNASDVNVYAEYRPRLVDYSIRDDESQYEPHSSRTRLESANSGSYERNNEVSEIVENI